ncbi:MAG: DUF4157 domain-containing protein [Spirochaetales bacterium]|nr:DUF4157 domain-containing protein [Spirochaetales bacterium]
MGEKITLSLEIIKLTLLLQKLYTEYGHTRIASPSLSGVDELIRSTENDGDHISGLDAVFRDKAERVLDADFSSVKIHTGSYADRLAKSAGADAVTIGSDIYFADGKYSPETDSGLLLLIHELQHVRQFQRGDRMVYLEDEATHEYEAAKVEEILSAFRFHDTDNSLFSEDPDLHAGRPDEEAVTDGSQPRRLHHITGSSLDDFRMRRDKPIIELILPNGKKVRLTRRQYDKVKEEVKKTLLSRIEEEKHMMTSEDYAAFMLKIFGGP